MSLPKYAQYKDSGVSWLGEVPAHWYVNKIKTVIRAIDSGVSVNAIDTPAEDRSFGVLKTSCVYDGTFRPEENKAVVDEELDRVTCPVEKDAIIVSRMNTPALVGAAGLVKESKPNIFLPDRLWQVHFHSCSPRFVHYWTLSPAYRCQVEIACSGASSSMQNLGQDQFSSFLVPLPSEDEQVSIAVFLDRETAKIDALIAEQETLLMLLAEKRQATISHAVTRGLDPDVPMKDSGIAWLGEVPAHWEIKPLGVLTERVSYGFTNPMPTSDEGPYLLTANDVQMGSISYATARRTSWTAFNDLLTDKSRPRAGDVLITKDGTLGRVAVFEGGDGCINQSVAFLRFSATVATPFMALALSGGAYQDRMVYEAGGTTIKHIYISRLVKMPIGVPPLDEQRDISCALKNRLEKLNQLSAQASAALVLLSERRSALIAAAVTGKIDVREIVEAQSA